MNSQRSHKITGVYRVKSLALIVLSDSVVSSACSTRSVSALLDSVSETVTEGAEDAIDAESAFKQPGDEQA